MFLRTSAVVKTSAVTVGASTTGACVGLSGFSKVRTTLNRLGPTRAFLGFSLWGVSIKAAVIVIPHVHEKTMPHFAWSRLILICQPTRNSWKDAVLPHQYKRLYASPD